MNYTWQYYDLVLLGIVVSVLAGGFVGLVTKLRPVVTVVGANVIAAGFIGYGLFVNGPVERPADLTDEVTSLN